MAKLDQSTRRGRLAVVFIGGVIIFGGLTLAGFYLSRQRQMQFEAAQGGESQVTTLEDVQESNDEVAEDPKENEDTTDASSENETNQENEVTENTEDTEEVAATGPSETGGDGGEQLPATGPSQVSEEQPSELPATGPETLWVIALVGSLVVGYLSFEYRRSRLAFQRAALRRQ